MTSSSFDVPVTTGASGHLMAPLDDHQLIAMLERLEEAVIITDARHRICSVNTACLTLLGQQHQALIGAPLDAICEYGQSGMGSAPWQQHGLDGRPGGRFEVMYRDASGQARSALMSVSGLHGQDGQDRQDEQLHHYRLVVLLDLASLAGEHWPWRHDVHVDALTGLPNQACMMQLLEAALHQAQRDGTTLTVCALDIDHFKAVNDRLGKPAGDLLLAGLARRLVGLLDGSDVIARIGGDEFVMLLSGELHASFLKRLQRTIDEPVRLLGQTLRLSASIGMTAYPQDPAEADILLRHATQAMHLAKRQGRNTCHRFDPARDQRLKVRQARRERIAQAIAEGELRLYYQPQVDLVTGQVIGLEALVRWAHPEEGILLPGDFLPVIEGTRLLGALGEWVIEESLRQLSTWQALGLDLPISVNLSPDQLLDPGFPERLADLLVAAPCVPPARLRLEVLETAAMQDIALAHAAMQRCQALGVSFAIDDFGTGFSSLTHIRQLPVDLIKIDRSFVGDMLEDQDARAIIESIIYMASRFRRDLVAEGVESLAHARALLALGCRRAQGFGIARPMSASSLPGWLADWPHRTEWQRLA